MQIKAHLPSAGEKNMTTSTQEQTLQVNPKLMEEVVKKLNEVNIAEIFKKDGLLKTANVTFKLMITSKNSLSTDNSNNSTSGAEAASSLSTSSSGSPTCMQICDPCPTDPSVACAVLVDCDNLLHTL